MNGEADSRYLMTPSQHRVEAMRLRAQNPNSRAAELHELAANMQDRQARLAANRAQLAASVAKPAPGKFELDWRVVWGGRAGDPYIPALGWLT